MLAQTHSKRWQKALQAEREQRVRLEETLEQLAKQHNHLERAFRGAAQANASADNKGGIAPGFYFPVQASPQHTLKVEESNSQRPLKWSLFWPQRRD